jgi:hypothetical protein
MKPTWFVAFLTHVVSELTAAEYALLPSPVTTMACIFMTCTGKKISTRETIIGKDNGTNWLLCGKSSCCDKLPNVASVKAVHSGSPVRILAKIDMSRSVEHTAVYHVARKVHRVRRTIRWGSRSLS